MHFSQELNEEQQRIRESCREKIRCCTEEEFEKLVKETRNFSENELGKVFRRLGGMKKADGKITRYND